MAAGRVAGWEDETAYGQAQAAYCPQHDFSFLQNVSGVERYRAQWREKGGGWRVEGGGWREEGGGGLAESGGWQGENGAGEEVAWVVAAHRALC